MLKAVFCEHDELLRSKVKKNKQNKRLFKNSFSVDHIPALELLLVRPVTEGISVELPEWVRLDRVEALRSTGERIRSSFESVRLRDKKVG